MKICLIGNNLTNFVLANVLANKNLTVDIIFNDEIRKTSKTRTIGISRSNFYYLKKISKNIPAWPVSNVKIFGTNKNTRELIQFKKDKVENFYLTKYENILSNFKKISQKNNLINIFKTKKKIDENFFQNKNYNLIVNSDPRCNLTKKYCYRKLEKNYESYAYTTLINHEKIKNNCAFQHFTNHGVLAFLPLSENTTSVVFSVAKKKTLDEKKILNLIKEFNTYYKILNFYKFEKFGLKFSVMRNYYHKNILFFGDVIHKVHPLAGQGFNMTLRDIKNLSLLIDEKLDLGLELDDTILHQFQKKTKHLNYIFGFGIDFIYEFFNLDGKLQNNLSKNIFPLLNKKNFLNKYAINFGDSGIKI